MKLRLLSLLCVPLLFAGCESPDGVAHYRYGNLPDRIKRQMQMIIGIRARSSLLRGRNMNSRTCTLEVE